jgi:hypothetical protein
MLHLTTINVHFVGYSRCVPVVVGVLELLATMTAHVLVLAQVVVHMVPVKTKSTKSIKERTKHFKVLRIPRKNVSSNI